MNPRLKLLVNTADDGTSDALTLKPDTLAAILRELERMCNSSDTISCEPVTNGGPGFTIKLKSNEGEIFAAWEFTRNVQLYPGSVEIVNQDTLQTDGTILDNDGIDVTAGKKGYEIHVRVREDVVYGGTDVWMTDDNGDATLFQKHEARFFSRKLTFDSKGVLRGVGPEIQDNSIEYLRDT